METFSVAVANAKEVLCPDKDTNIVKSVPTYVT